MKRLAAAFGLLLLLCAPAIAATPAPLNAQQELRARALQKELRCVVCQGQSLDESNAPLAADIRGLIRAQIAAGQSDRTIKHFLVARYGAFILMKPPLAPATYLLWLGPGIVLLLGGAVILIVIMRATGRKSIISAHSPSSDITDS